MGLSKYHIKTALTLGTYALIGMWGTNRGITTFSARKNMLRPGSGKYFRWQYGDVFYHKYGNGSPILLLHELHPAFSSYEWEDTIDALSLNHTVYVVDLPGCGRSVKVNTVYTNYYYVLFLKAFIKSVIKKRCDVIASGYSSSFTIEAAAIYPGIIRKIYAVSPMSLKRLAISATCKSKAAATLLSLPVIGTFVYNMIERRENLSLAFTEKYLYNPFRSQERYADAFYEGAHYHDGRGKYLLASIEGKYMTVNLSNALQKTGDRITLIFGDKTTSAEYITAAYKNLNPNIQSCLIPDTKDLPHIERPEAFLTALFRS